MVDRLAELRRQRALVQEHLAWLERELVRVEGEATGASTGERAIAPRAEGPAVEPPRFSEATGTRGAVPSLATASTAEVADAEAILDEYRVPTSTLKGDVRKGCFLYFAAALLGMALLVGVLWLAFRR